MNAAPFLLACAVVLTAAGAAPGPTPTQVSRPAATVVMDAKTGRVISSHNARRPHPPASATKMLTAILVAERLDHARAVAISPHAAAVREGSTLGLAAGERWSVADLLAGILLSSANDAAVALAEASHGSVGAFVAAMNSRAAGMGATGSRFSNPHGLHAPGHHSTAYDLAVIARHLLAVPALAGMVRLQAWVVAREGKEPRTLASTNRLLSTYPGADGVKTGYTAASGPSIVGSATREGRQLIVVVLNSPRVFEEAAGLLDLGFGATPGAAPRP